MLRTVLVEPLSHSFFVARRFLRQSRFEVYDM